MQNKESIFLSGLKLMVFGIIFISLFYPPKVIGQSHTSRVGTKSKAEFPKPLSNSVYEVDGSVKQLTLLQIASPYSTSQADLRKYMKSSGTQAELKPVDSFSIAQTSGDRMFIVVSSLCGNPYEIQTGDVIGVVFGFSHFGLPRENWNGQIFWHPLHKVAYLVLVRSYQDYVTLSIHSLEVSKKIADYPITFDPKKRESWPPASTQLSELKTRLSGDVCGVGKIDVIAESNSLLIYAERQDLHCSANYFRFNLETKEWAEVTLQEKKIK